MKLMEMDKAALETIQGTWKKAIAGMEGAHKEVFEADYGRAGPDKEGVRRLDQDARYLYVPRDRSRCGYPAKCPEAA